MKKNSIKTEGPDDSLNGNLTAIPKTVSTENVQADPDLVATQMDYGEMNIKDAMESGYTDAKGHAIARAKKKDINSGSGITHKSDKNTHH